MNKRKFCQICGKTYTALGEHLKRTHKINLKDYYDQYIREDGEGFCKVCGKETKWRGSIAHGYQKYCSQECKSIGVGKSLKSTKKERYGDENWVNPEKNKSTKQEKYGDSGYNNREKCKNTCLERYGVENVFQTPEVLEKIQKVKQERYGDPFYNNSSQLINSLKLKSKEEWKIINTKRKNTKQERYGNENWINLEKIKEHNNNVYGVDWFFETKIPHQAFQEKYGVKNPSQVPEIQQKKNHNWHDYQLPSGDWIKLQGYEPKALDILLNKYNEEEILHRYKDMPEIWYVWNDSTWHRYYPDFYIAKDNLIVEVKGEYTYNADLEKNLLKEKACKYLGYDFEFWVLGG